MKAQFVRKNNKLYILFKTGFVREVTISEAYSFIENFKAESNYPKDDSNLFEIDSFKKIFGDVLAAVNEEGNLIIYSEEFLKEIFEARYLSNSKYISTQEYADKHNKKRVTVLRLCRENRIPGVIQKGRQYLIPGNAPYPNDMRYRDDEE